MRILLALTLVLAATPALAATGQELFDQQCGACHTVGPASNETAPSLKGVVGRPIASLKDFQYSDALKAKGGVWTEAALNAFIANPNAYAPGTAMYGSAPVDADRAAIIAYLKTVQ